jgi:cystathionine gamma-synthase
MKVYVGAPPNAPVGTSIPYGMPHGVSVSLPTWKDNVDYEEGHPRIAAAMSSGYPRFYIHHQIDQVSQIPSHLISAGLNFLSQLFSDSKSVPSRQLARLITLKFGQDGELCILCPSAKTAASCQTFLAARSVQCRLIQYPIRSTDSHSPLELPQPERVIVIHAALFPAASFSTAKQFWQHTGDGISSRTAERCLTMLGAIVPRESEGTDMTTSKSNRGQARNRHYAAKAISTSAPAPPFISSEVILPPKSKSRYATRQPSASSTDSQIASSIFITATPTDPATPVADEEEYLTRYVEERYGRNLDLSLAPLAKLAMRRRLAGVLGESGSPSPLGSATPTSPKLNGGVGSSGSETQGEESIRGVAGLTENDVWLYSCGMSAIFHAHQLAMGTRTRIGGEQGKSVCFGYALSA